MPSNVNHTWQEWETEGRNNLVVSWYTNSSTLEKIEDNRVSNKKLLVAGYDKRCEEICK